MDLTQHSGYRLYDPDPRTATGIQGVTTNEAGSGYKALAAALANRLRQRAPTRQPRRVVCFDLYHSPDMDVVKAYVRA